jgi:2-polyprenyl-3-methyl-5-hydroxy-6-metoxy-1,4-benzoquinol methylase
MLRIVVGLRTFWAYEREMKTINVNGGIEVQSVTTCYLCGAEGHILYGNLRDRLFGAPGEWNLKKCPDAKCGLIWLDPMPVEADLHKVYENYYTHYASPNSIDPVKTQSVRGKPFRLLLKLGYQVLLHLAGMSQGLGQARLDALMMYLAKNNPGTLLDVGCGDGSFLARMELLGWDVRGVDIDHESARIAHETFGVPVYVGTLQGGKYPDACFNAITMSHVIEHVYDPITLLTESYRILKPGGSLVVVTPNIASFGYRHFERNWRGLEPPRHLHLFSRSTIENIANRAGIQKIATWISPANAEWLALASIDFQASGYHMNGHVAPLSKRIASSWFQIKAVRYFRNNPDSGEELFLKATK